MQRCLARGIRGPWRRAGLAAVAIATVGVVSYAAAGDPLADLKAGVTAFESQRYAAAIALLQPLGKRLPKLADYVAWFHASSEFESGNFSAVPKLLEPVWNQAPASPLVARSVILAAKAWEQADKAGEALKLLRKYYGTLPQPQGDLAMATAFAATGDTVSAVVYYQGIYYGFPNASEAAQASAELTKLRAQLGDNYPPAMPDAMLGRALKLLESGNTARAKQELEALVPQLGGTERELVQVRIGIADYNAKDTLRAQRYLNALEVSAPEADAERIYYLLQCARRLNNQDEVKEALDRLGRQYPNSKWRLEALVAAGNHYLVENQMDAYEPIYRACYESFPNDSQAAGCHWKVVWGHYLRRREDAADLLRAHVRLFPASQQASDALYFLGRLAEASHDTAGARAYYTEITTEYPNYYYTVLARERLADLNATPGPAGPSAAVNQFLRSVAFPPRARTMNFEPNATTKARLERSRMLTTAGLDDWAEGELRFGAQTDDQPYILATELAALSSRHAGPDQAMRYIKHYAGGYLYLPVESAPLDFWKLAFPIPYRTDLERYSKQNGLDPFLMAALIRQESEFNPKVVSRSNARGLTQIMPSTGRELSRRLKVTQYSTAKLFQPGLNLQLGTFYLKSIADSVGGRWEAALAAYNAGLSRARVWSSWGEFREPAEFIETVPFTETRDYIQTVLRNADMYRRLYGPTQEARAVSLRTAK
ncbi:MAG: transglycosylase SLT domain-containing protein [Bryobacteraceae bacterium]